MKLKIISFVFLILFSLSCSGGNSDGGTDVGTIVTNPSTPTTPKVTTELTLAPDLSKVLMMETFLAEITAGSSSENEENEKESLFVKAWNHFLEDPVITILDKWEEEELLLKAISDALIQENITINNTLQTVTLASPYLIWGGTTQKVEVILDSENSDYIRIFGYDSMGDSILWHYLVNLDSNNQAVKGMMTFVNPLAVLRSVELIFDLSNPNQSLIALRTDKQHPFSGNFYGSQTHLQCSSSECIVEYVTAKEEKIDTGPHFRFSYNGEEACLGAFGKDPTSVDIVKTFGVEGSLHIDATTEVTKDTCTITEPVWDGHLFIFEEILDLETALNHLEGNSITPALIDSCLTEAECE